MRDSSDRAHDTHTHAHSERDGNKFTDMYIKRLMSIHRPFGHPNLHREKMEVGRKTIWHEQQPSPHRENGRASEQTKSIDNDMYKLQIRYRLVHIVGPHPHSLSSQMFWAWVWVFVLFGRSLCDGNDCVWIVRDVESDVLVLWFDSIKANIDGKCYVKLYRNRSHPHPHTHNTRPYMCVCVCAVEHIHSHKGIGKLWCCDCDSDCCYTKSNDSHTTCKIKQKKKLAKTTIEKVSNVCKYVTRVDPNCSVWLLLVHKYVHRSPWLILGFVLLFISPN